MAGRIDPAGAKTPGEFVLLLRRAAAQAHHAETERLAAMLHPAMLPPEELAEDLLRACDMSHAQINRWMRVYDELAGRDGQPAAEPPDDEPDDRDLLRARHAAPGFWTWGRVLLAAGVALAVLGCGLVLSNVVGGPRLVTGQPPTWPPTDQSSAEPPSTPEPSTSASPRRPTESAKPGSGTVTLASGQGWDLDKGSGAGALDVRYAADGLHAGDNGKRLALVPAGTNPTQQTCAGFNPGQLDRVVGGLSVGRSLCVRTTESRWARVTITALGSGISFNYVVFT